MQPGARQIQRMARAGLAAGIVAVVASLLPGWFGYQSREDASGRLALIPVAGAASSDEASTALVVPVPHLASVVEATSSMPGRLALLTVPLAGLLAASLVQRAGRHWPADRVPGLPRSSPRTHLANFPVGPAPRRPVDAPADAPVGTRRPDVALLTLVGVLIALGGMLGRRALSRS